MACEFTIVRSVELSTHHIGPAQDEYLDSAHDGGLVEQLAFERTGYGWRFDPSYENRFADRCAIEETRQLIASAHPALLPVFEMLATVKAAIPDIDIVVFDRDADTFDGFEFFQW